MGEILLNAFGFILIILSGFTMKKMGVLKKEDGTTLSKIIINVTLPAVLINGLRDVQLTGTFIFLIVAGVVFNLLFALISGFAWRHKSPVDQGFIMYNASSFNLGNFTMPFMQTFFASSLPFLVMFDIGNAFMMFGLLPILINQITHLSDEKPTVKNILLAFGKSIPFMSYLVMFTLTIFSISLPDGFHNTVQLFANANGFLSMFMIGLFLDFTLPKSEMAKVTKILTWRYGLSISSSVLIYFFLPVEHTVKIILMILVLSPIATFSTIKSAEIGAPRESAGFLSSMSILISFALIVLILLTLY